MARSSQIAFLSCTMLSAGAWADAPCDFKGVSVGDRMTPAEIMATLGVTKYEMNPAPEPWDKAFARAKKYGLIPAGEMRDWDIGPHCNDHVCVIPYGIGVGNDDMPVRVTVGFSKEKITEIDVAFGYGSWESIQPILHRKYGAQWVEERDPNMVVTDLDTKRRWVLKRITSKPTEVGRNPKTGDSCEIWATNIDIVFKHHDPLGPLHSIFVLRLISTNF
jgi:hypothetical protein